MKGWDSSTLVNIRTLILTVVCQGENRGNLRQAKANPISESLYLEVDLQIQIEIYLSEYI